MRPVLQFLAEPLRTVPQAREWTILRQLNLAVPLQHQEVQQYFERLIKQLSAPTDD